MRRRHLIALTLFVASAQGGSALAQPRPLPVSTLPATPQASLTPSPVVAPPEQTRGDKMRDYHAALAQRRLGSQESMKLDDVRARDAEAEDLLRIGRIDEAIARLVEIVEHPRFESFAENEEGRAAIYLLGDALASAGAYDPARAYLRRVIHLRGAWDQAGGIYARRAVKRLVEIAIESDRLALGLDDVRDVPATVPALLPEDTRGEISYLTGRAKEEAGDPEGAITAYAAVTQRSRFWAQSTYLQGLIHVEKGRYREGENLFCKIADPKRQSKTTPVFADEHYFAVRDLARLALGRVAHEQYRFDDSRYYYYLVPRDSDRLAEALYEGATSRYEKKDYDGARELLDELKALSGHHTYEDEAWILEAYIDLAQCKFPEADKLLVGFIAKYEPVRNAARRVAADERGMQALLQAARSGSDAGGAEVGGATVSPDSMRAISALVRIDPSYGTLARKRAVLEHEASGLRLTIGSLNDLQKNLATNGGVRAAIDERESPAEKAADTRLALESVKRQIDDLEASQASATATNALRKEYADLEARLPRSASTSAGSDVSSQVGGKDLPDLIRADGAQGVALSPNMEAALNELRQTETLLARDALKRVDLRLSRLLRRARLGRIESVIGRKRALEVEIEAINNGILPSSALDSLDAARYLKDNEEYWPFEGDDWPDEFVGGEDK